MERPYLIITGGVAPVSLPFGSKAFSRVIVADSGFDRAKRYHIGADLIVGDLDSREYLDEILALGVKPLLHDKDESDTELAIRETKGAPFVLVGGGGGRLDHIASLFSVFERLWRPLLWLTGEEVIVLFEGDLSLELDDGTSLSIFSRGVDARVRSKGLVWELDDRVIGRRFMSLSNRVKERKIYLTSDAPLYVSLEMNAAPLVARPFSLC